MLRTLSKPLLTLGSHYVVQEGECSRRRNNVPGLPRACPDNVVTVGTEARWSDLSGQRYVGGSES